MRLVPPTTLLALACRAAGGAVSISVLRELLDVETLTLTWHAAEAIARLATNLAARRDIAGETTGRLQIVALDDADGPLLVEQLPRSRILGAA